MASGKQVDEVPYRRNADVLKSADVLLPHALDGRDAVGHLQRSPGNPAAGSAAYWTAARDAPLTLTFGDAGVRACCRSGACGYAQRRGRPTWNARRGSGSRIAGISSSTWPSSGDARFRNASSPPITALSSKPLSRSRRSMLYRDRAVRSELVTGLRDALRRQLLGGGQQRDSQSVRSHVCTQRGSELDHCRGLAGGHE